MKRSACGVREIDARRLIAALFVLLFVLLFPLRALAATDSLWELTPYRVQVILALTPEADQGCLAADLLAALPLRAESVVGARWVCTATAAPLALREAMLYRFETLQAEQVLPALGEEDCDKALLVRVGRVDGIYRVETRDFDVRTQLFSLPVSAVVYQRERLADAIFQSLLDAFAPLAKVETVERDQVTLRARAAAVPSRDPTLEPIRDKSLFRPVVRVNDRTGKARRIQPIDWTFLVGQSLEGSEVTARLVTGLHTPLTTRRRGRMEQLALVLHPLQGTTTLELRSADKQARPLLGYQVYSHPIDSKETDLLGTTDVHGALRIEPDEGKLRVLLIKSGGAVVARLPVLPGLTPTALAPVPDDQPRLLAEGLITGFQEELVDLIARRQVLMARVRSRMKAGKQEEAKQLFGDLRRLRTQQDMMRTLLVERQRHTSNDPQSQRRIDKLFDDTQTVINRFLDARQIDKLERELYGEETAQAPAAPPQEGT